ncbi:glycosyltransferase family 2 protein [Thermodesulfobacteriota bacterium]
MRKPRISVIIPTYNRAELLIKAIESVLQQTFHDYEIIVVDDGSTDNTRERLEPFMDRLNYIHQENRGKSTALNTGLREAGGEWIAILDSDDRWLPEKLEEQMKTAALFGEEAGFIFTDAVYHGDPESTRTVFKNAGKDFREESGIIEDAVDYVLHPLTGIYLQCSLIRHDLLSAIGDFDENLRVADDTDMIFRLALRTKFAYVNRSLTVIDLSRDRELSLIRLYDTNREIKHGEREYMYEKWLSLSGDLDGRLKGIIVRRLSEEHEAWANHHLVTRRYDLASESIRRACALRPNARCWVKRFLIAFMPSLVRIIYQLRHTSADNPDYEGSK